MNLILHSYESLNKINDLATTKINGIYYILLLNLMYFICLR